MSLLRGVEAYHCPLLPCCSRVEVNVGYHESLREDLLSSLATDQVQQHASHFAPYVERHYCPVWSVHEYHLTTQRLWQPSCFDD